MVWARLPGDKTRTGGLDSSSPHVRPASSSGLFRALPSTLRFRVLFQWFFTALSVRPGSDFAISAHLLPILCAMQATSLQPGRHV